VRTESDLPNKVHPAVSPGSAVRLRHWLFSRYNVLLQSPDLVVLVLTGILTPLLLHVPFSLIRIAFGLPIVLFVPGFALLRGLISSRRQLTILTQLGMSFGLSIAVIPWLTLMLHLLGINITPDPIAMSLAFWIVFWAIVAMIRRPEFTLHSMNDELQFHDQEGVIGGATAKLLVGVATVALVLPALVFAGMSNANEEPTAFAILGTTGLAEEYPREIIAGESVTSTIQILSNEPESTDYFVTVSEVDDREGTLVNSQERFGPFTVRQGERFETSVQWTSHDTGSNKSFRFDLFRGYERTPYRTLKLTVNVEETMN
jgi:uncharacterized membrane protein